MRLRSIISVLTTRGQSKVHGAVPHGKDGLRAFYEVRVDDFQLSHDFGAFRICSWFFLVYCLNDSVTYDRSIII
jgi:hypothetical protein